MSTVPTATYRLQIQPAFTFFQAAEQADYLAALGVSHAYLSPILQPEPGSIHGYDVVSHERLNEEAGGGEAFDELCAALRAQGLGVVVDVVPNHMATPTPAWLNQPWWRLLRDGRESDHAHWFDVDWDAEDGHVLLPVLGASLQEVMDAGQLVVARDGGMRGDEPVLRHFDREFPLRPGTETMDLPDLVAAQVYRLCHWREGAHRLNYRRFFDVTTLAAIRVEDAEVFRESHRLLLELFEAGSIQGFRIDHPDGLADPAGYLARLDQATRGAWVVVEKILEGTEELPANWSCAGTTGYDWLLRVGGVFVDPAGEEPLTAVLERVVGPGQGLAEVELQAKQAVVDEVQAAEVNRLMRLVAAILPGEDQAALRRGLAALLVSMDRYRAYVRPGHAPDAGQLEVLSTAEAGARALVAEADRDAVAAIAQLARGSAVAQALDGSMAARHEFTVRFQQTCGPVMAKGVEDTAFYRYARLVGLNEVGGDPARLGIRPTELHEFARRQLATWPTTMTTLSTHDTKRSEDVRARLAVLSELPTEWEQWLQAARVLAAPYRDARLDPTTEYFLWQTAIGAWPIHGKRFQTYATKAIREASLHTSWIDPDEAYEAAVRRFVEGLSADPAVTSHLATWASRTAAAGRATILGQKLLQLVLPGVPDVYQGTEVVSLSLVDPDNRHPVDFASLRRRLARLDSGAAPTDLDDEKLLVASRALRMRRSRPEWFTGDTARYADLPATSEHALAVGRGDEAGIRAVAVVTRLSEGLAASGGWGDHSIELPPGHWRSLLDTSGDVRYSAGPTRLAELLSGLPIALLQGDERA